MNTFSNKNEKDIIEIEDFVDLVSDPDFRADIIHDNNMNIRENFKIKLGIVEHMVDIKKAIGRIILFNNIVIKGP